jgi:hypothetical protein
LDLWSGECEDREKTRRVLERKSGKGKGGREKDKDKRKKIISSRVSKRLKNAATARNPRRKRRKQLERHSHPLPGRAVKPLTILVPI